MAVDREALIFCKVDLWDWVRGTIDRVGSDSTPGAWNRAWSRTYQALGGQSPLSGVKGCPMKGAYTLYFLGRIEGGGRPLCDWSLSRIRSELSKNGAYAVLALDLLRGDPMVGVGDLWDQVRVRYQRELGEGAAEHNAGAVTVAFKLFRAGKILF